MRLSRPARSATSGSRAAFSITVVPLARTAAMRRVSVAVWLGTSRMMRLPMRESHRPSMTPWDSSKVAPRASRPVRWSSTGRDPKSSPPGMDTQARPQLARRGPRTTIDARMRSTSSYGASGTISAGRRMWRASPSRLTSMPMDTSRSDMVSTSVMRGTLRSTCTPSASRVAAISLSTEFLAPPARTVPDRGGPGRTTKRSTAPSIARSGPAGPQGPPPRE